MAICKGAHVITGRVSQLVCLSFMHQPEYYGSIHERNYFITIMDISNTVKCHFRFYTDGEIHNDGPETVRVFLYGDVKTTMRKYTMTETETIPTLNVYNRQVIIL